MTNPTNPGSLLMADIKARVMSMWPDVTEVKEGQAVNQIPWGKLTTPYAVIIFPGLVPTDEYSCDALAFLAKPSLFYVCAVGQNFDTLRQRAWDGYTSLMTSDLPDAQTLDCTNVGADDNVEPNRFFAGEGVPFRAAQIDCELLVILE